MAYTASDGDLLVHRARQQQIAGGAGGGGASRTAEAAVSRLYPMAVTRMITEVSP